MVLPSRPFVRRGLMTVANVVRFVPTVAHDISAARAAQLLAERHIDAVPVTKDDRVVGLFTERDYFDKVLNARHQATRSSMVAEVGIMGPDLVVARPNDSVHDCLAVMAKQNLMALPVVRDDGHAIGTVSVLDLTRHYMDDERDHMAAAAATTAFSEPAFFPENLVLPDGGVHDEELDDPVLFTKLTEDPTDALLEHTDSELESLAADRFCEGSVFPEFTATEELLLAQVHGEPIGPMMATMSSADDEQFRAAYAEVLGRMDTFSQPSDFPEAEPVDEAIHARA